MGQFFCYRHVRNDLNIPFYIGMSKKRKYFSKTQTEYTRAFDFKGRKDAWFDVFNAANQNILVEIVYECDSKAEAMMKEKEFISIYGRTDNNTGILCNKTDGGTGSVGYVPTKETRIKNSIVSSNPKHIERLKKLAYSRKGIPRSEEVKRKITESKKLLNKKWSDDFRGKMCQKIGQYDSDNNLLNTFSGRSSAARSVDGHPTGISKCLDGLRKHYKGFIWKII